MNREMLLEKIDRGRSELEILLARISEERMLEPALPNGWTVKDMLAHLEGWALRAEYIYRCLSIGEALRDPVTSADDYNARLYAANRNRTLEDVLPAERAAFNRLRAVAETAPEADLFDPQRFAWTEGRAFYHWIAWNSDEHYAEHVPDLRAWLGS